MDKNCQTGNRPDSYYDPNEFKDMTNSNLVSTSFIKLRNSTTDKMKARMLKDKQKNDLLYNSKLIPSSKKPVPQNTTVDVQSKAPQKSPPAKSKSNHPERRSPIFDSNFKKSYSPEKDKFSIKNDAIDESLDCTMRNTILKGSDYNPRESQCQGIEVGCSPTMINSIYGNRQEIDVQHKAPVSQIHREPNPENLKYQYSVDFANRVEVDNMNRSRFEGVIAFL